MNDAGPTGRHHIVIIDASIAPTGALRAAANLARAVQDRADTLLVCARHAVFDESDLTPFATVLRVPMRQIRRAPIDLMLFAPTLLAASLRIRKRLGPRSILVMNDFYLMHGGVLRLLGIRTPIVTWVRTDPQSFPRPLRRTWLRTMELASDRIVSVSDFIRDRLAGTAIGSTRIYDPIDTSLDTNDRARVRSETIVHIANYTGGKGQDDAIRAFARIADRHPRARLAFHGGDMGLDRNRQYLCALKEQAVATGYAERIVFHGYANDIAEVLADKAVALVLSHRESFSLTCLEASQCGVPVIATRCGGPEEIVEDGRTGMLCDVGDVPAIADAMDRLLADPERAARMGTEGAALVRHRFSPQSFDEAVKHVLRDAVAHRASDPTD